MTEASRQVDEKVVTAIRLRIAGLTSREIGRLIGTSGAYVRSVTDRAMKADLAESGEPAGKVLEHYW